MKLSKFASALFFALSSAASVAQADVITFDDITYIAGDPAPVANGYEGFSWSNIWTARPTYPGQFFNGLGSGTNSAFMASESSISSFSSANAFTFDGLKLTKMYYNGLTRFDGYVGDLLTFTKDIYSIAGITEFATFNWAGVTRVDISVLDGSERIVFDDVTFNTNVSPVSEPTSIALFGAGVALFGAMNRRRKEKNTV